MAWTTPNDVVSRWLGGGEPDVSDTKLLTFIEDAEDAILAYFPNIQLRIDTDTLPISRVKRIVARIVIRAYKSAYNPLSSFQQATGPFSQGGTFEAGAKKYIALSDDDIADLSPTEIQYEYGMTNMAPQMSVPPDTGILYRSWPAGANGL